MILAVAVATAVAGCTRHEIVERPYEPPPKENSIVIGGGARKIELLRYEFKEVEYRDETKEEIVALRVMVDGASITADLPTRLLGGDIDLASRDLSPSVDGTYYTSHLSARGEEGFYCRMLSWVIDPNDDDEEENDPFDDYAGWFSISRGTAAHEWIFEWELTANGDGASVSAGYVKSVFEQIPKNS